MSFIDTFLVSSGAVAGFRGEDAGLDEAVSVPVSADEVDCLSDTAK
jgi:hypothetical protein